MLMNSRTILAIAKIPTTLNTPVPEVEVMVFASVVLVVVHVALPTVQPINDSPW